MSTTLGKTLKSHLSIAALALLMALSYECFVFPNAFAPAGINGLATIVQYLFHISIGCFSLFINVPLILLAWRKLNADFARKSLLDRKSVV